MRKVNNDFNKDFYCKNIYKFLHDIRSNLLEILEGGISDSGILVTALTHDSHDYFFIRILFSDIGGVDYYHNDPEWDVCFNFLKKLGFKNNLAIEDGRIVLTQDISVLVKDKEQFKNGHVCDASDLYELIRKNKYILFRNNKSTH